MNGAICLADFTFNGLSPNRRPLEQGFALCLIFCEHYSKAVPVRWMLFALLTFRLFSVCYEWTLKAPQKSSGQN